MSFDGKVVLITGGAGGIGAETVRQFARLGAKVAAVDMNENLLYESIKQIENSAASSMLPIVADVTKDAKRIVDETIKHFGKLDVLVNNAGVVIVNNIADLDLSIHDRIFDTCLRSVVNLTHLCLPYLEKTNGNVINISSNAARIPYHGIPSYSMAKAAVDQFTRCAALELGSKGIRVNTINSGIIRTSIFKNSGLSVDEIEKMLENISSMHPVGRIGLPSDVSSAIVFLADNKAAAYITGINISVDGGSLVAGLNKI